MKRFLFAMILFGLVGGAAIRVYGVPDTTKNQAEQPKVTLTIDPQAQKGADGGVLVDAGAHAIFHATLRNDDRREVTLVMPGDGSDCGWRTPILRWKPAPDVQRRCGNINALQTGEVFTLKPGETTSLGYLYLPFSATAGDKRKVSLEYENDPGLKWSGLPLGKHDEATMRQLRASTPLRVTSNVVEVTFREPAKK
jgi:hypothetical protein